jgi:hypothetical protein
MDYLERNIKTSKQRTVLVPTVDTTAARNLFIAAVIFWGIAAMAARFM